MSRWAPASEPPITASRLRHTSARIFQSASSSPNGRGESPVRSSSAITMSSSVSNGSPPRASATSPTVRPVASCVFGRERLDDDQPLPIREAAQDAGLLASGRPRPGGDAPRDRPAPASAPRPAGASSPASPAAHRARSPTRNDSRIFVECGIVSATTRPPRSAATVRCAQLLFVPFGLAAETPSTFQFSGRSAASDMSVEQGDVVVGEAR